MAAHKQLTPEAQAFRDLLLCAGGKMAYNLSYCLTHDASGTNAFIQTVYNKWNGELNTESAIALSCLYAWLAGGKSGDLKCVNLENHQSDRLQQK